MLANYVRHVAHRWRLKIDIEGAGDRGQAREFSAAERRHQRRIDDGNCLQRQGTETILVDPERVTSKFKDVLRDDLMVSAKDGPQRHIANLRRDRAQIAAGHNCEVAKIARGKHGSHQLSIRISSGSERGGYQRHIGW